MSQFWQIPFTKMIQTTPKPLTNTIFTFTLISLLTFLLLFPQFHVFVNGDNYNNNYVQEACNVTHYQVLCVQSLGSYSDKAKRSPTRWAWAGVSVTIAEVKLVSKYLDTINNNKSTHHIIRGTRNRAVLADCVECIQNTLDNVHKSLGVLRRLSIRGFDEQMNDALTWLSAALTNEDTCIRGFEEERGKKNSKEIIRLCDKVKNVSYITSNALALVNNLATTGFHGLGGD